MQISVHNRKGWTEAVFDEGSDAGTFHQVADALVTLGLTFTNQINDLDTVYWDFDFKGSSLVLFQNVYEGIAIFPKALKDATQKENDCVIQLSDLLSKS